ncbi:hypothetical protein CA2015_0344 [Cyclobacterium amurskyense]|uniref:Uncharacterized protein n=1 Tax=Cyclobacterium amurskyense TaxID=320787 RepID=A0A0H4PAN4_9BACT|nr:hypothetical protein CA2015_0344 [Cyclobacterium amurskyense]
MDFKTKTPIISSKLLVLYNEKTLTNGKDHYLPHSKKIKIRTSHKKNDQAFLSPSN